MSISLKKAIVNTVWEFLPEEKRYQLLLNEIEISNLDELSEKFISLGGIYKALSNMTHRHTIKLFRSEYNQKLEGYFDFTKKSYLTSADNIKYRKEQLCCTFEGIVL
jgi:hypothetical protein